MKKEYKYQASDFTGTLPSGKKWAYGMGCNMFTCRNIAPMLFVKIGDTWERATCKTLYSDDLDFLYGKHAPKKYSYLPADIVAFASARAECYRDAMKETMYFRGIRSDLPDEKYLELFYMWRSQNVVDVFFEGMESVYAEFEQCMLCLFGEDFQTISFADTGWAGDSVLNKLQDLYTDALNKYIIKFMKELADDDED